MKTTILGTGTSQGIPVIGCHCRVCQSRNQLDKRLRTSILVETASTAITVDTGPDFRQQMLTNEVDKLDGALMTHEHNDHVAGLDDIRPFNFMSGKDFPVYGLPRVLKDIEERFPYIFATKKYPGAPSVDLIPAKPWEEIIIGDLSVRVLPVQHGNLDILGYSFGNLIYLTDVKYLDEQVIDIVKGVDVLVINALHHKSHHSHLNLKEALKMIDQIRPAQTYLTHLSHSMGLHEEINKTLPLNVKLAYDGLTIET